MLAMWKSGERFRRTRKRPTPPIMEPAPGGTVFGQYPAS